MSTPFLEMNTFKKGNVFNAEWFGVPQERRRYIVVGIRRDIYMGKRYRIGFAK